MSLRRSEQRKRTSAMSAGKWTLLVLLFLLFIVVWFVLYVRSSDSAYQKEENQAIKLAKAEAGIKKTDEAFKHVWDETVWVVTGKDGDGVKWFVWERKDGIVKEKAEDGLTKAEAVDRFEAQHEGRKLVRIIPGWFGGQPAWEIRYVSDPGTERQAIDFYSFKDGTKLKTYDLPGK